MCLTGFESCAMLNITAVNHSLQNIILSVTANITPQVAACSKLFVPLCRIFTALFNTFYSLFAYICVQPGRRHS